VSQQLQGQLQTQHSSDMHNVHNGQTQDKDMVNLQEHIDAEKRTNKQKKIGGNDNYEHKTLGLRKNYYNNSNNSITLIQFNSILYYLCA
jgi:hypothetical protein